MRDTRARMHAIAEVHRGSDIRAVLTAANIRAVFTAAIQSFTDHDRSPWRYPPCALTSPDSILKQIGKALQAGPNTRFALVGSKLN